MFRSKTAWFSTSCPKEPTELWVTHKGKLADQDLAQFIFSDSWDCEDTKHLLESEAYLSQHLAVFSSSYVIDAVSHGVHNVILGEFFLVPSFIQNCLSKRNTYNIVRSQHRDAQHVERVPQSSVRQIQQVNREQNQTQQVNTEQAQIQQINREKSQTQQINREQNQAQQISREQNQPQQINSEKSQTQQSNRGKSQTQQINREKSQTHQISRKQNQTQPVNSEHLPQTSNVETRTQQATHAPHTQPSSENQTLQDSLRHTSETQIGSLDEAGENPDIPSEETIPDVRSFPKYVGTLKTADPGANCEAYYLTT